MHSPTALREELSARFCVYIGVRNPPSSRIRRLAVGLFIVLTSSIPFYFCSRVEAAEFSNLPCPSQDPDERAQSANALLEAGNTFFAAGHLRQAEKSWLETRDCAGASPSWPKAVFNLGILEMQRVNYPKAIGYFNEVLQSHPNDKEPGGNIMQVYRNYSNRSALQISMCYEKMANYRDALHYAWLAKMRYPYQSWCGTCLQSANISILQRIARLSFRVYGVHALAVMALAGIFLSWKRAKNSLAPSNGRYVA